MWDNVDSSKATDKQIKYAETLLEACYGDINKPIYTMSKQDISVLIEETKKKLNEKGINYHNSTTEAPIGTEVEGSQLYAETGIRYGRQLGMSGSAISALQYATSEVMRRSTCGAMRYYTRPSRPFYGAGEIETLRGEE